MIVRLASLSSVILGFGLLAACGQGAAPDSADGDPLDHLSTALEQSATNCNQRSPGVTGIDVAVRVHFYQGLIHGRNGTHEIAYGTVTSTSWVYDHSVVDTSNVELALNVKSAKDPTGLPNEVKMTVGESVEVRGEYIPAATANAHDSAGPAAVLHFTHSPCGFITIAGHKYQ